MPATQDCPIHEIWGVSTSRSGQLRDFRFDLALDESGSRRDAAQMATEQRSRPSWCDPSEPSVPAEGELV
jgi:hypothetical protein